MKNIFKVFGIIIIVMIIGLFAGCGTPFEEEDDGGWEITIIGIPSEFEWQEVEIIFFHDAADLADYRVFSSDYAAIGRKHIENGRVTVALYTKDGKGFTTKGSYCIELDGLTDYPYEFSFYYSDGSPPEQFGITNWDDLIYLPEYSLFGDATIPFEKFNVIEYSY